MVLIDHMQYEVISRPAFNGSGFKPTHVLFWAGGVDIFFIISGFIIFTVGDSYFGKAHATSKFLLRRVARVVPSYWIFTTLMLLSILVAKDNIHHSHFTLADVATSYGFYPHINAYGTFYPVLSLGWTLNFEMFFYVLFAVALGLGRRWGMVGLALTLSVCGIIGMVGNIVPMPFAFWCDSIVLEFAMGMALAYFYRNGVRIPKSIAVFACLGALMAVGLAMHLKFDITALKFRAIWMGIPALTICASLVLIETKSTPGPIMRALIFGGNISFAIYLSHPFTMNATAVLFDKMGLHSPIAFFAVGTCVILFGAAAVYLLCEKPLTLWLTRQLNKLWRNGAGAGVAAQSD